MKRKLLSAILVAITTVAMYATLSIAAISQTPSGKWIYLGAAKDVSFEVYSETKIDDTTKKSLGLTRNILLAGHLTGYYSLMVWEFDCKERTGKRISGAIFSTEDEAVKELSSDSVAAKFEKDSFGGRALSVWCGEKISPPLKTIPAGSKDIGAIN